jgi:hypothetical protein
MYRVATPAFYSCNRLKPNETPEAGSFVLELAAQVGFDRGFGVFVRFSSYFSQVVFATKPNARQAR